MNRTDDVWLLANKDKEESQRSLYISHYFSAYLRYRQNFASDQPNSREGLSLTRKLLTTSKNAISMRGNCPRIHLYRSIITMFPPSSRCGTRPLHLWQLPAWLAATGCIRASGQRTRKSFSLWSAFFGLCLSRKTRGLLVLADFLVPNSRSFRKSVAVSPR